MATSGLSRAFNRTPEELELLAVNQTLDQLDTVHRQELDQHEQHLQREYAQRRKDVEELWAQADPEVRRVTQAALVAQLREEVAREKAQITRLEAQIADVDRELRTLSVPPAPAGPAAAAPTFVAASHPPHHSHSQPHGADVGVSALPGVQHSRPKENQDSLFFQSLGGGDFVAGVLDGHGHNGGKISKWVAERLKAKLLVTPLHPATAEAVLVDMFVSVHAELAATAAAESAESGTTVVVCVKRGGTLYVANAGDSRCVLGHMTGPARMAGKPLTSDHTPIRPDEAARIVQSGGVVGRGRAGPNGPPRVYNPKGGGRYGLCLSRSVGDCSMATAGVVPVPEVTVQPLGPNDKFVLLASDGVWAAISTEEAAEVAGRVTDPTRAAGDVSAATQAVWAQRDPAYRDDITVLILKLRN